MKLVLYKKEGTLCSVISRIAIWLLQSSQQFSLNTNVAHIGQTQNTRIHRNLAQVYTCKTRGIICSAYTKQVYNIISLIIIIPSGTLTMPCPCTTAIDHRSTSHPSPTSNGARPIKGPEVKRVASTPQMTWRFQRCCARNSDLEIELCRTKW